MLKIWKRAWKRKEDPTRSQSEQDTSQDGMMGGPSNGASFEDVAVAVPPSDTLLAATLSTGPFRTKRSRNKDEPHDPTDPPFKKPKTDSHARTDSLRNHLPEILGPQSSVSPVPSISIFRDQVLAIAREENSKCFSFSLSIYCSCISKAIAILPPVRCKTPYPSSRLLF